MVHDKFSPISPAPSERGNRQECARETPPSLRASMRHANQPGKTCMCARAASAISVSLYRVPKTCLEDNLSFKRVKISYYVWQLGLYDDTHRSRTEKRLPLGNIQQK